MIAHILLTLLSASGVHSAVLGSASSDVYPPSATMPNTALFPPESVVGYQGGTPTGAEAFAYQTAPPKRFVKNTAEYSPLVLPIAADAVSDPAKILVSSQR